MKVQNVRKTNTKNLIVNSFLELLEKKAFDKITIKDITDLSKINRATFYAHYTDKYELFDEILEVRAKYLIEKNIRLSLEIRNNIIVEEGTILIDPLLESVFQYLNPVKEHCPFSYKDLFPKLREKMIDMLIIYFKEACPESFKNEDVNFKTIIFAKAIYDAGELKIMEKTNLSKEEIIISLNSMFKIK